MSVQVVSASIAQTVSEAGAVVVRTPLRIDPKHPMRFGEDLYPSESKLAGEEGVGKARVDVDANGRVVKAELVDSTGFASLDAACVEGFSHGRFIPATENGSPVASSSVLPLVWLLAEPAKFEVGPAFYPPAALEMKQEGDCVVRFQVSEFGDTSQVKIVQSSGFNTLDYACVMAVRHAHFVPQHADAHPVESTTTINIEWKLPKP